MFENIFGCTETSVELWKSETSLIVGDSNVFL